MGTENEKEGAPVDLDAPIKLKHPVKFGDEVITEVTVRRPKGKDLKGLRDLKNSHDDQLKLIARLIGHPQTVVDEIDLATDLQAIMERVEGFL